MNFLRNYLDKQKPKFEEGGKLHKLHSVFTGFESFLFVPNRTTTSGCNIRDAVDLKRTMIIVVIALIPALLFGIYNVGYQHFKAIGSLAETGFFELFFYGLWRVLPMIIVSYVVGLGIEFAVAQIRGHEINEGFLVSGLLIPLIMPVNAPLWMIAVSTAFAVIIGKEIFGGTGMNIWNPALLARAFFFFSYPSMISGDKVWIAGMPDGFSQGYAVGSGRPRHTSNRRLQHHVLGIDSGIHWRDLYLLYFTGCYSIDCNRNWKLENHAIHFYRRILHGLLVKPNLTRNKPVCSRRCYRSFGDGRVCLRRRIHGDRSGNFSSNRKGKMDLRIYSSE